MGRYLVILQIVCTIAVTHIVGSEEVPRHMFFACVRYNVLHDVVYGGYLLRCGSSVDSSVRVFGYVF